MSARRLRWTTCKEGIAGLLQSRAVVSATCALFSDITNWWLQQQQLELPKEYYLHSSGLRRTRVVETHLFFTIMYLHARHHSHLSERLGRVDGLLSPAAMACGSWHAAWLGCFGARLCGRVAQPRVQASPATALGVYQRAIRQGVLSPEGNAYCAVSSLSLAREARSIGTFLTPRLARHVLSRARVTCRRLTEVYAPTRATGVCCTTRRAR